MGKMTKMNPNIWDLIAEAHGANQMRDLDMVMKPSQVASTTALPYYPAGRGDRQGMTREQWNDRELDFNQHGGEAGEQLRRINMPMDLMRTRVDEGDSNVSELIQRAIETSRKYRGVK